MLDSIADEATFLDFVRYVLASTLLPFNAVKPRSVVIIGSSNQYGRMIVDTEHTDLVLNVSFR